MRERAGKKKQANTAKRISQSIDSLYTRYENEGEENERRETSRMNKQRAFHKLHTEYERTRKKNETNEYGKKNKSVD